MLSEKLPKLFTNIFSYFQAWIDLLYSLKAAAAAITFNECWHCFLAFCFLFFCHVLAFFSFWSLPTLFYYFIAFLEFQLLSKMWCSNWINVTASVNGSKAGNYCKRWSLKNIYVLSCAAKQRSLSHIKALRRLSNEI